MLGELLKQVLAAARRYALSKLPDSELGKELRKVFTEEEPKQKGKKKKHRRRRTNRYDIREVRWSQVYRAPEGGFAAENLGDAPMPEIGVPAEFTKTIIEDGQTFIVWVETNFLREERCPCCQADRCVQRVRLHPDSVLVVHDVKDELS